MNRILRTILVAVVVAVSTATAAVPPVNLECSSRVTTAPGYFRVRVVIEPQQENRQGCLYVIPQGHGDQITRCWSLNGDQEPRSFWHDLKDLPAGRYDISAALTTNDDHRVLSRTLRLTVMGADEPEPDESVFP